ncbi:Myc-type, basic helix-loop-helix (bHLH) domain [Cinara cedri]|uniref:Myc-type, basic helix-loop-helix (BHLH) domain n=1 Tax=Cinara cedri TaxID=506608 RepID=A0A5E4MN11_9HEMI|nr:Myc-type, basic helix-loop-helix (bHLH) domain [Cinara cedri]
MVNPSTESILNQMTNLAMDIAMDYVLPASPMSDVCKSDLFEFEREVVAAVSGGVTGGLMGSLMASTVGITGGCCGRPPTDLCKKNSYMGAAACDSCYACLARRATSTSNSPSGFSPGFSSSCGSTPSSSYSPSTTTMTASSQQTAETTMDISWCQFDGCEFDTADNSYLDICDWIFYADRYALTDENREKVQKAFQMVPPGEVTGYVFQPPPTPAPTPTKVTTNATAVKRPRSPPPAIPLPPYVSPMPYIKSEIKSEPDDEDDYLWSSDNHLQPVILKVEPDADILQITELDHSYLQTTTNVNCHPSTVVSPAKHHPNHLVDMLGLVTPPPSRSQSSEEEEIDVVNDSWDMPDRPRKGATMADIMKRGIVKKREPPVTKWKNTVKRKHKSAAAYPAMPPPPPKKHCGGLSLLDRYKKDNNQWKNVVIKDEPVDDPLPEDPVGSLMAAIKQEPLDDDEEDGYDVDADFDALMKNEPEDMFEDEYDDYDDENDMDWDKVFRGGSNNADASTSGGGRGRCHGKLSGGSSTCSRSSSSSTTAGGGRKKKKKKKKKNGKSSSALKHHHRQQQQQQQQQQQRDEQDVLQTGPCAGKKIKYEPGTGYSYKTKLMDPVKRALHNDLEKSRRVETSMLFMNLSMQVSFLDDNRKIPSKLSILRGAKRECDLMMLDERRLLSEKHVMQQKQRMLRDRLFELRREQYHRRYGKNNPKQQPQQ